MTDLDVRGELLRPYTFWGLETEPGIYFFCSAATADRATLRVDYIGQAEVVSRRVRFGSHHRLTGSYRPDRVLYLPLRSGDASALTAIENLFITLYRPVQNQSHMPRVRPGDLEAWTRRLLGCLNRRGHIALYRFLAANRLLLSREGHLVASVITVVLSEYLSGSEQAAIVRALVARETEGKAARVHTLSNS